MVSYVTCGRKNNHNDIIHYNSDLEELSFLNSYLFNLTLSMTRYWNQTNENGLIMEFGSGGF